LTFVIASLSTGISAVVGLALALALHDIARHQPLLNVLLHVPVGVPHTDASQASGNTSLPQVGDRVLVQIPSEALRFFWGAYKTEGEQFKLD
jgi:hypothetical protein